ncbi:MAG TPA: GGDEF domain-containing protein [Kofleriaceae bacterium]|nr:GGDEF domain-containing protein [Kofleriaceae bacterium]
MSRAVLCVHSNPEALQQVIDAVREAGADPIEAQPQTALRLSRAASVVVAAGDGGLDLLARLALDRPGLPRVALIDAMLSPSEIIAVVDRFHPFAILPEPLDPVRLTAVLRDALAGSLEGVPAAELTQRVVRPETAPDFDKLVRDRLTGADGYHYLRLRLEEELERASRYTRPLALALIDIDDLRGVNDRYGRAAGDFALRQIATTLQAGARAVDRVGRWAGGTFAMLLPETNAGAAYGLAERLRADISARRFVPIAPQGTSVIVESQRVPARLRVTVSCGVASTLRDGVSRPASLIQRSDAALWRAKHGGRNRSVVDG